MDGENKPIVEQLWKKFNIVKALWIMDEAWKEISPRLMNAAWKKLYPSSVHSLEGFLETEQAVRRETVQLANDSYRPKLFIRKRLFA